MRQYSIIIKELTWEEKEMEAMREVFKELYISLNDIKNIDVKTEQYYSLITDIAIQNLEKFDCEQSQKNQILGEIILISEEVLQECLSLSY